MATTTTTHRGGSGLARREHAAAVALELDAAIVDRRGGARRHELVVVVVLRRATRPRLALRARCALLRGDVGHVRATIEFVVRAVRMHPMVSRQRRERLRERILPRRGERLDVVAQGQPDVVVLRDPHPHAHVRQSLTAVATPWQRCAGGQSRVSGRMGWISDVRGWAG
jgi:hypothetical protein